MAEVYVTLGEAAELERVKYNTMVKRVLRKQESFVTKTEKSENGGKDVVLVAVSSLSKQARNAWKEREKLKSFTEEFPDKKEDEQKPEVPWYVNTDVDWYIENYKERYYKAVELGNVVRKFLQYDEGDRTKYAEEFAQKYLGKGQRTLYRYTKAYLEASAWADKLEKEDGAGREFFKVLCLCRKPKETGCFPSIKPEVKQVIKNIWFNEDFARNQGTREMLYEKLTAIANINKWEKIPSYQTVTRYISYLMEDEGMRNAWFLASRGTREYKNKVMVKGSRDTKGLQVMQIVMGDEHTFDCWVSYKQPNGKVIAIKPHLAAWVDMRSRVIMGDVMCKDANSDILKQSLLKMIYSEPGGVPEYLYIDNGKDYTAKTMTGRDRNDRSGMNFDNETMGFYKSIGIKDDHRALPYEPWSKGQIERFFRTVCNKFTRWMKSYTGTLTGSKTSDKVDKDIKRMLERGELLTLEEFYEKWHEWLTTVYMHTEHSGLKKMGETYKKPYDCFMNEDRYFKAAPPKSYATMLMMKSENVLVRNIGITKWGYEYRSDELCDYIGRKVDIKYDPDDMAVLYVFDQKGKRICEAYCQELLQIAPKVTQKALEEHLKMQKRQQKRDRERLEEARRPFEELNEQYVGFNETTGGIELMIGGKKQENNVLQNPRYKTKKYRAVISEAVNTKLWDEWESIYTNLFNENHEEDARTFYEAHEEEMLLGAEVLWEEKLSYYDLMEIKVSEGTASFNSELQNDPIDPESATFNPEWFDYYEPELMDFSSPEFVFVGANDPSLGKNKKSDTSSIINLALSTKTGYMYVVDASVEKRKPDVIIEDVFEMNRRLKRDCKKGFYKFGVEVVQFQYFFKEVMAAKSAEEGEYIPIEEIQSTVNKVLRIESLQPVIKNKYLKFNREHKTLLKQLQEFPMGKNDDAPDGLQMAVQLAQTVKAVASKANYKTVLRRRFRMGKGAY